MGRFFVYVIKSKEGYKYTGMTEDLETRLIQHNDKSLSFWTKRGKSGELVYKEEFDNKTDALRKEKWLKTGVGREYLIKVLSNK
jgi:putative endonuclease